MDDVLRNDRRTQRAIREMLETATILPLKPMIRSAYHGSGRGGYRSSMFASVTGFFRSKRTSLNGTSLGVEGLHRILQGTARTKARPIPSVDVSE